MTNKDKAEQIAQRWMDVLLDGENFDKHDLYKICMQMAEWKDEQYKTAYVVTRSDLHYDEVERVFFDKEKVEEYCKQFNENENEYRRNITKIEVS